MNVNLLYSDREWVNLRPYYDWSSICQDLGLKTIFDMAKSGLVMKNGKVQYVERDDLFLAEMAKKVMQVPLETKEEVLYRQEVLKDCIVHEGITDELYQLSNRVLEDWNKLGRKTNLGLKDTKPGLITEVKVLKLLVEGLSEVKALLIDSADRLTSEGMTSLCQRVVEEFSDEKQQQLEKILDDMMFYVDTTVNQVSNNKFKSYFPKMYIECGVYDGLKLGDMRLEELKTVSRIYTNPSGIIAKLQGGINSLLPNCISPYNNAALLDDTEDLEFQVISYVMACCSEFQNSIGQFFDQLHLQIGFYRAAINIRKQMQRYRLECNFPEVGEQDSLSYDGLQEMVMRVEQSREVVDNSGCIDGKMLAIVTGANQGGKSTFLRSIGIAQVMMQCGLMVAAKKYRSGLYPNFFTHFTRREDSAMNSGRLDDELRRMDRIISHIGKGSLILLNESFATTTEKEGSAIAYDIIRALKEENVRIYTVTHLLSFAQKIYDEESEKNQSDVAFMSAERKEDGTRTFRILPHAPELTSFGLELYDEVILGKH